MVIGDGVIIAYFPTYLYLSVSVYLRLCFMTNPKVANMKNTVSVKSANGDGDGDFYFHQLLGSVQSNQH